MGLVAMLYWMGVRRRRLFSSLYGAVAFDDLDEEQAAKWVEIDRLKFNSGFWRFITVAYMI